MKNNPLRAEETDENEEQISILEILHTLWFWRRIMFSVMFIGITVAYMQINKLTPKYTASTKLIVKPAGNPVTNLQTILSGDTQSTYYYRNEYLNTEKEVLSSSELIKRVIEKENLVNDLEFNPQLIPKTSPFFNFSTLKTMLPDYLGGQNVDATPKQITSTSDELQTKAIKVAVKIFQSKLDIKVSRNSSIVTINITSLFSENAAKLANSLANEYINELLEVKFRATKRTSKWLDTQLFDLKKKVLNSEKAVEFYKKTHNLIQGSRSTLSSEKISEINSQLILAKARRVELNARYQQVKSILTQKNTLRLETTAEVLKSIMIQNLRQKETLLDHKISEYSVEYGRKHPKMIQIRVQAKDLKRKILTESRKIASGLKNELEVAQSREKSLLNSLKQIEQISNKENSKMVELRALEREASANKTLFNTFLNRYKETSSTENMAQANSRIISLAEAPTTPSFPNKRKLLMISTFISIFIGILIIFLIIVLNTTLQSPEKINKELQLATIGLIPLVVKGNPISEIENNPHSVFYEAMNSFLISLMLINPDSKKMALQITSTLPEEGKSTLAICLAQILVKSGKKVIIIDADLRRPSIAENLAVDGTVEGIVDLVLAEEVKLSKYIHTHEKFTFDYILHGSKVSSHLNSTEIFSSAKMKSIISVLKHKYDFVIFDSPPIMPVADARILGHIVDETLMAIRWNKTPIKVIQSAISILKNDGVSINNCILQQVNMKRYASYGYGYGKSGYYYHYSRYNSYYK